MIIKKVAGTLFLCRFVAVLCIALVSGCANTSSTYLILTPIETDSLLSAWLIKTHVDSHATFSMVSAPVQQSGSVSQSPTPTNLISVLYPPVSGATQFEQILVTAHINNDSCIDQLKEASRVLEVMAWRKSQFPAVVELERQLKMTVSEKSSLQDFEKAFVIIDRWCKEQNKR